MGSNIVNTFKPGPIDLLEGSSNKAIRSIPELIQYNAEVNGDALFCQQAFTSLDNERGHADSDAAPRQLTVTMRQLRDAVWRCSERLRSELGLVNPSLEDSTAKGPTKKSAPVALFMDSDLSILVHLFALMALGIPVALLSARLSTVAIEHLLDATKAETVVASPRLASAIQRDAYTTGRLGVKVIVSPPLRDDFEAKTPIPKDCNVCGPGHFINAQDRNVLILHSSGTTGLPKAIYQPHAYLLAYATCHTRTEVEDVQGLNITTLPLYHGFGLVVPCLALGIGKPFWLPPPHVVPTGPSTAQSIRSIQAKSLMTVPYILDEIVLLPPSEGISALLPLQFVACGGGPLNPATAEKLAAAGVKLIAHFGTTETGPLAPVFAPGDMVDSDWRFWRLRTDLDIRIEPAPDTQLPVGGAGVGEAAETYYQLTMTPLGWETPFVLQDRLMTSSRRPGRDFRAVGRMDDLIVLATGEKVQPRILEAALGESPLAKAAVAFGNGQFELGVIVEPAGVPEDVGRFRAEIWPVVAEAGSRMDSHARLTSPASIVVTRPGQSLPRSDKGAILRKAVYEMFDDEIRAAYELMERSDVSTPGSVVLEAGDLEGGLMALVHSELAGAVVVGEFGVDDDLFERGLDSLQAVRVRRAIQRALGGSSDLVSRDAIARDFVYRHPSVRKMARALLLESSADANGTREDEADLMESLFSRYRLPDSSAQDRVILLTGSSGSLGSHLLAHLVAEQAVRRAICLRRQPSPPNATNGYAANAEEDLAAEQIRATEAKGLQILPQHREKIKVLPADPSQPNLGLNETTYSHLQQHVTHIVHAAWPMDFQRSLSSFQSQLQFLQTLLQLARDARKARPGDIHKPRLLFVSSISVVGRFPEVCGSRIVSEEPIRPGTGVLKGRTLSEITTNIGYGRAKLICERIVGDAVDRFGDEIEATCVRVGQVSGSRASGLWNSKEHFPALVKMSQAISKIPQLKGTLSWLPVDTAAAAISEILFSEEKTAAGPALHPVYHVENPTRQDWPSVLNTIASELNLPRGTSSPFLDFEEWIAEASRQLRPGGSISAAEFPDAEMLIDFLRQDFQHMAAGGVVLDTYKARGVSAALRAADRVDPGLVASYVKGWRRAGFLH